MVLCVLGRIGAAYDEEFRQAPTTWTVTNIIVCTCLVLLFLNVGIILTVISRLPSIIVLCTCSTKSRKDHGNVGTIACSIWRRWSHSAKTLMSTR